MNEALTPYIFNIHRFALDDGPGIRTTVFFKGCPLSCVWCHNPESVDSNRGISFDYRLCIDCGDCVAVCKTGAITTDPERICREKCSSCGECAEKCPSTALKVVGERYSVDDLTKFLLRDKVLYETSGGGVTFSGGEPTLFIDYLEAVLRNMKLHGIHTAIQTCGMFDFFEFMEKLFPFLDLIFFDLKLIDPKEHTEYTGIDNEMILSNFSRLKRVASYKIIPRTPLVPGFTATENNIKRISDYLNKEGLAECVFLPYNPAGIEKRALFGIEINSCLSNSI